MCQIYGGSIYDAVEDEPELRQQWLNQWFIAGTPMTAQGSRCTLRHATIAPKSWLSAE